ncbi:MAG: ComEA family DNA-binding protein [Candidatus Aminicenantes bacterium]
MKNLFAKGLIFSVVLSFLFSCLLSLQVQALSEGSGQKVNINTASVEKLQTLPRIGEKVAQRIVDFRKEHGPFKKIEEIMKVKGIGEKTFKQIKDLITVGEKDKKK